MPTPLLEAPQVMTTTADVMQQDIDQAVRDTRSRGVTAHGRVLIIPPGKRLAGTGGEKNMAFLGASLAGLGMHVVGLGEQGSMNQFLADQHLQMHTRKSLWVDADDAEELLARLGTVHRVWQMWRNAPRSEDARRQTRKAVDAAGRLLHADAGANRQEINTLVKQDHALKEERELVCWTMHIDQIAALERFDTCIVDLATHAVAALLALDTAQTKIVWYVQNAGSSNDDDVLTAHAHLVACSAYALQKKLSKQAEAHAGHVVENGIARQRFLGAPHGQTYLRDELHIPSESLLIGNIANLSGNKDQATIIKAFASILAELPQSHLALIGRQDNDHYRNKLDNLVASHGVGGHIHFIDFRDDIDQILPQMDVVVSASHREGYGLATAEAMLAGRALVLSSIAPSVILAGATALYFAPGNHEQLARHLLALRDPSARAHLGDAARERAARTVADLSDMLGAFVSALEQIMQLEERALLPSSP